MEPNSVTESRSTSLRVPLPNNRIIYVTQTMVRPLIALISICFSRGVTIDIMPAQIEEDINYVIAPNHGSWLDPLVIMYHIPYRVYRNLGPYRVMVLNKLFDSALRPIIAPLGSFPAKPHSRYRYGLDLAQHFMSIGTTIAIFPEGKRNHNGSAKPRRGVAELTNQANTRLIPVRIKWVNIFFNIIPTYKIHVGSPVDARNLNPDEIMKVIYALPLK